MEIPRLVKLLHLVLLHRRHLPDSLAVATCTHGVPILFFSRCHKYAQLLHHPIRLCETERYKYANLHATRVLSFFASLMFDQVVRSEVFFLGQVNTLTDIVVGQYCRWQVLWFYIRSQCLQLHTPIADYTKR